MNPEYQVMRDWIGRPLYMTPNIYRVMQEMDGRATTTQQSTRIPKSSKAKRKMIRASQRKNAR